MFIDNGINDTILKLTEPPAPLYDVSQGGHFFVVRIAMVLKEPQTHENQISLLKSKGFIVADNVMCVNFLKEVNYYRFAAYYLPFRIEGDQYKSDISIERIKDIYHFDQELRNLVFATIEKIEISLRARVAYFHAHTYGADGYMNSTNYRDSHKHEDFCARINDCIRENSRTPVVKHHKDKYNGNFPIWVIIEFFTMGMLSHFYLGMTTKDRKKISKDLYKTTEDILESWLRCLTDLRNKCAHYSRLYFWIFTAIPKIPKECKFKANRGLFTQLLILKFMYPTILDWNKLFVENLEHLIIKYENSISLDHISFPENWKELLIKS